MAKFRTKLWTVQKDGTERPFELPRTYTSEGAAKEAGQSVVKSWRMAGKIEKGQEVKIEVTKESRLEW